MEFGTPPISGEWDVSELADWVELMAATSARPLLVGNLQTAIGREVGNTREADVGGEVWAELGRRAVLCAESWPLRISSTQIVARPRHPNALLHYFLCALSLGEDIDNQGRRLFEECVGDLVRDLTGRYGLRIGSPRGAHLPGSLDDAVNVYVAQSKEEKRAPLPATDKDFGLDVVTWRTFPDGRGGYLHFIGQCATGKRWFDDQKHTQLQVPRWAEHIGWAVTPPVRFFAVPHVVPPDRWRRVSIDAGLVLDRPRLLDLALRSPLARPRQTAVLRYCRTLYEPLAA